MKRLAIRAFLTTLSLAALAMLVGINPATAAASPKPAAPHVTQMGVRGAAIRAAATPLKYQGGAVETTPVVYISWWGSQWNTGFTTGGFTSAQAQTYITGFFANVGGSSWDNIDTQYCQGVAVGTINCGTSGTHITNPTGQL